MPVPIKPRREYPESMNLLGYHRTQRAQLTQKGRCDLAGRIHRDIPGNGAARVPQLLAEAYNFFAREAWHAAAPGLTQIAKHLDLRAVHLAIRAAPDRDAIGFVDLAGGKVFIGRQRKNPIDDAGIERHRGVWISGAR